MGGRGIFGTAVGETFPTKHDELSLVNTGKNHSLKRATVKCGFSARKFIFREKVRSDRRAASLAQFHPK
jgi:hypothetical protein